MATFPSFGGIIPRVAWHSLPENGATEAHDVKLRNGKLEPWRDRLPVQLATMSTTTVGTAGCCILMWDSCVSMTEYVRDYGRIFLTGNADRPQVATLAGCIPTYTYLGVPVPQTPPVISGTAAQGRDCAARSYVYTYVNGFGEESAPSPNSSVLTVQDGSSVSVSGFAAPPVGYGIVTINIYRAATAHRDEGAKEQAPLTDMLLVATIPVGTTSFTDTVLERNLGMILETREVRPPPEALRHITHIKGTGTLAGVTNNQVHFSENFQPYSWPSDKDLTLPHHIVNMVAVDNFVIVSTDAYPYVISPVSGCEYRKCAPVTDIDTPLADISCGYPHSAIATPFGMIYSSKDGLVLVSVDGRFQIITAGWFSTDDWAKLRPDTVRLAYWRGYLICVTDNISFFLEIDGDTYKDFTLGNLVTVSDVPVDMIVTQNGQLLLLEDGIIYQWEGGTTLRPYRWISREISFGGRSSPTTAKVRTNDILFTLYTPVDGLVYERKVTSENPFRLGRLGRHYNYRVGCEGTGVVEYLDIGMAKATVNFGQ